MASPFCTLPEELRQEIISYLDYYDAWSLKKTSKLFLKVVEIPTLHTFLENPHGAALGMLEDWAIIPIGYEACYYCCRLLKARCFSRYQRWLTSARQKSGTYDYQSYKPEKHFCIKCGVRYGQYEKGRPIFVGFGDAGSTWEVVTPCIRCHWLFKDERRSLFEDDRHSCRICGCCETCVAHAMYSKHRKVPVPFFFEGECEHLAFLEADEAFFRWQIGWCDDHDHNLRCPIERPRPKPQGEPLFSEYEHLPPNELLEMVGERMHEGETTIDEGAGTSGVKGGFLNTFEGYDLEHYY